MCLVNNCAWRVLAVAASDRRLVLLHTPAAAADTAGRSSARSTSTPGACPAATRHRQLLPHGAAQRHDQGRPVRRQRRLDVRRTRPTRCCRPAPTADSSPARTSRRRIPAFDASGNSQATRIVVPATFFGVKFGLSTDPTDLPDRARRARALVEGRRQRQLSGDLRAWSATWNKQDFNQGAPKPDGSTARAHHRGARHLRRGDRRVRRSSGRARSSAGRSTTSPVCGISPAPSALAAAAPTAASGRRRDQRKTRGRWRRDRDALRGRRHGGAPVQQATSTATARRRRQRHADHRCRRREGLAAAGVAHRAHRASSASAPRSCSLVRGGADDDPAMRPSARPPPTTRTRSRRPTAPKITALADRHRARARAGRRSRCSRARPRAAT